MSDSTRSIWSTSTTLQTAATARGEHYVTSAIGEDTVTRSPRGSVPVANLSMVKRRAAKQPFSRLSDGEHHPVTVRRMVSI